MTGVWTEQPRLVAAVGNAPAAVALGLCRAAFLTRLPGSMLSGVTPLDPVTFVAAGLLFLAVSGLASFVPARRAMTVSPVVALRAE